MHVNLVQYNDKRSATAAADNKFLSFILGTHASGSGVGTSEESWKTFGLLCNNQMMCAVGIYAWIFMLDIPF